jgi:hypothetical protein
MFEGLRRAFHSPTREFWICVIAVGGAALVVADRPVPVAVAGDL